MVEVEIHLKISREKASAAILKKGMFSVAADEAFKALEQTVQAYESQKDPFADHRRSSTFYLVKTELPEIADEFRELHKIYQSLGYAYRDGEMAKLAVELLKKALKKMEGKIGAKILPA